MVERLDELAQVSDVAGVKRFARRYGDSRSTPSFIRLEKRERVVVLEGGTAEARYIEALLKTGPRAGAELDGARFEDTTVAWDRASGEGDEGVFRVGKTEAGEGVMDTGGDLYFASTHFNTRYIPMILYQADGRAHVLRNRTGQRQSPADGWRISREVSIAYDRADLADAALVPDFRDFGWHDPIESLSEFFKSTFSIWFLPGLFFITGAVTGGLSILYLLVAREPVDSEYSEDARPEEDEVFTTHPLSGVHWRPFAKRRE